MPSLNMHITGTKEERLKTGPIGMHQLRTIKKLRKKTIDNNPMFHGRYPLVTMFSVLAMLSNHYCVSLLKEVQTAIKASDWQDAGERLQAFVGQAESYLSAEVDLIYPWLATSSSVDPHRLNRLTRQQQQILRRRQRLENHVSALRAEPSGRELTALIRIFAAHGRTEQHLLETLPDSEVLLHAFAQRLHQTYPNVNDEYRRRSNPSFGSHGLRDQTNGFDV